MIGAFNRNSNLNIWFIEYIEIALVFFKRKVSALEVVENFLKILVS